MAAVSRGRDVPVRLRVGLARSSSSGTLGWVVFEFHGADQSAIDGYWQSAGVSVVAVLRCVMQRPRPDIDLPGLAHHASEVRAGPQLDIFLGHLFF